MFVSYAGPDRPWAEWAGQQLEAAGYVVELDVWDWASGSNAVLAMNDALARAACRSRGRGRCSANNLAIDLRQLGDHEQARELMEQVVGRRRHVLGEDHPDTIRAASDLVVDLHLRGQLEQARELDEAVQAGYARLRGERPAQRVQRSASMRPIWRWKSSSSK